MHEARAEPAAIARKLERRGSGGRHRGCAEDELAARHERRRPGALRGARSRTSTTRCSPTYITLGEADAALELLRRASARAVEQSLRTA
jgi:hypothetical protein